MITSIRLMVVGVIAVLAWSLFLAGSASAVVQRSLVESFGSDGTAGTYFENENYVAVQQASHRLYVLPRYPGWGPNSAGIYAFDIATVGSPTPLGAPFSLDGGISGSLSVDDSTTESAGNIYNTYFDFGAGHDWLQGRDQAGTPLGAPFPIAPGVPGGFAGMSVDSHGNIAVATGSGPVTEEGRGVVRYTSHGTPLRPVNTFEIFHATPRYVAFDSHDNLYVSTDGGEVWRFAAASNYEEATHLFGNGLPGDTAGALVIDNATSHILVNYGNSIKEFDEAGTLLREFGGTYGIDTPDFWSVAIDEATNEVYVAENRGDPRADSAGLIRVFGPPIPLPKLTTDRPKNVTTSGATLFGKVEMDGSPPVVDCFFEYGTRSSEDGGRHLYTEGTVPCDPAATPGAPIDGDTVVSGQISGLANPGGKYHYRLVAKTAEGTIAGNDQTFTATNPPVVSNQEVIEVTADHALLKATINPQGVFAGFHVEYGPEDCAVSECESTKYIPLVTCSEYGCERLEYEGSLKNDFSVSPELFGLTPGTEYHFRVVSDNDQNGVGYGADQTFRTFPLDPAGVDPCPNAQERKLSSAGKLSHCRAYELVSAADAGGYDVASNLDQSENPLPAYPGAEDSFLYTTSFGKLPGVGGSPVNFGTDPYVAHRGPDGWRTSYVGIPATAPSQQPFASTLSGADSGLDTFAFGASKLCSPCFADGSTGIPIRLKNGELVQGMKGSIEVSDPQPAGNVAAPFSADGSHFVFGSTQQFEPAGNAGSLTIYDRNLNTDETQVVSTMPDGSAMSGQVAELAISANGRRILIGKYVRTDAAGNDYYDLYMHLGNAPDSVPVVITPDGVLYAGMTNDGTRVFFTTSDSLADDADASPDLFEAEVGDSSAVVSRISIGSGGTGNSDACIPPEDWNVAEGGPNCGALAFAGGAGVAAEGGTVYFMSPELLDGPENGLENQPNVYVARPGSAPKYVGLLDNSYIKPPPTPPQRPLLKSFGPYQAALGMAVDQSNGDFYVDQIIGEGKFFEGGGIWRFTSAGTPDNFTAGPGAGTNKIPENGFKLGLFGQTAIGVDNAAGSPFNEDFYVKNGGSALRLFDSSGEELGELTGFENACGLAVDQSNGDVYVGDSSYGGIRRLSPTSGSMPVSNANYTETSIKTQGFTPCQVAVDGAGHVYAAQGYGGQVREYDTSDFADSPPEAIGTEIAPTATGIVVDQSTNELYVDIGSEALVYKPDGTQFGTVGTGTLEGSPALALKESSHHVFAVSGSNIFEHELLEFGYKPIPYKQIDHPASLHGVMQAATRNGEDFQVTPNGDQAIFTSKLTLTATPSDGRTQVYRYDAPSGNIVCVSCIPTGAIATGDAFLTATGSNLSDDGRVFFSTPEQLTLRDTNRKNDAYEWDEGAVNLISTGTAIGDAGLASVDASGKNAYFFTRESIVPQDDNGSTMKVYDAREGGGFGFLPAAVPCQAADECRGAGTPVAPPPPIGTYKGTGGNVSQGKKRRCKSRFVRKKGHCVKHRKHRKSKSGKRSGGRG